MDFRHERAMHQGDNKGDYWRVYGPHGVLEYRRSYKAATWPSPPGNDGTVVLHRPDCWNGVYCWADQPDTGPCPGDPTCGLLPDGKPCHEGWHPDEDLPLTLHPIPVGAELWAALEEAYRNVMPDPSVLPV